MPLYSCSIATLLVIYILYDFFCVLFATTSVAKSTLLMRMKVICYDITLIFLAIASIFWVFVLEPFIGNGTHFGVLLCFSATASALLELSLSQLLPKYFFNCDNTWPIVFFRLKRFQNIFIFRVFNEIYSFFTNNGFLIML